MSIQDQQGVRQDFGTRLPEELRIDKEDIGRQLEAFSTEHRLKSLQDRLNIGLNEVAILAYDVTNARVHDLVAMFAQTKEEQDRIYEALVKMSVEIQNFGPWKYAEELADPQSPEMKAWFMLAGSETIGYEREMDLNDAEFKADVNRILGHLDSAVKDPLAFLELAKEHLLRRSAKAISFDKQDTDHRAPMGEGHSPFLPIAIQGYVAGIAQDAEGWVYVGARDPIQDSIFESIGLTALVAPNDRDPSRTATYYVNEKGQKLIKKIHPGFLVMQEKYCSFDVPKAIVKFLNDENDSAVLEIADKALGRTRVVQTTEKNRSKLGMDEKTMPDGFMRMSKRGVSEASSDTTAMTRPRDEFYLGLEYIRSNYVYIDALAQLTRKRKENGETVTEHDKSVLSRKIWNKMNQKVEELRYVNELLADRFDVIPRNVHEVIDMAGGAGDLGLAVTNEFLSTGREVTHTEIVDPQEGVAEFMKTIIDYLPFRDQLEQIAVHNTAYLQDAHITPDSLVVAKHACGTLTDAIISQWKSSESPMLVAMTCCQGKAKGMGAPYGFKQKEWDQLCKESDLTNTEVPELPGKKQNKALEKLNRGNIAMIKIDMARVNYLRRHGCAAELTTTDKFPKGDVIFARRLPGNFMEKLEELQKLEKTDPLEFDTVMMRIDVAGAGGTPKGLDRSQFGEDWKAEDFVEMSRRFIAPAFEPNDPTESAEVIESPPEDEPVAKIDKETRKKELLQTVFADTKGKIDMYLRSRFEKTGKPFDPSLMRTLAPVIMNRLLRNENESPEEIRKGVDEIMKEMGN